MVPVLGFKNVFFDQASIYPDMGALNEKVFLFNLFSQLKNIVHDFESYEFFIFCGGEYKSDINLESKDLKSDRKKILFYLSDESGKIPSELSAYYSYIFKIHLKAARPELNIYPFPLGYAKGVIELPYIDVNNRKYNCFYSGNLNPGREEFWIHFISKFEKLFFKIKFGKFRILNKYTKKIILKLNRYRNFDKSFQNSIIRFTSGFGTGFNPSEYSEILQQSKIVLCPKGFISPECYRHYEALRAGCILISEQLPETYFYKGSHIIQLENWDKLDDVVKTLLDSPESLTTLSKKSKEWYDSHMSEKAIAQYIKNIIE